MNPRAQPGCLANAGLIATAFFQRPRFTLAEHRRWRTLLRSDGQNGSPSTGISAQEKIVRAVLLLTSDIAFFSPHVPRSGGPP